MSYVDGFVIAVPTANKELYIEHAKVAAKVLKEYGAIKLVENWGDDVPKGEHTSLPHALHAGNDETVVFSWIVWPSKEVRDVGLPRAMSDHRLSQDEHPTPFDGERMMFGGFQTILEE